MRSVTATLRGGRRIGTRECRNVKPLCLRDTALAALDGVCSNSDAAHRYRFATHSFNGYRCCPTPPFAQTSLVKSYASALHSHVARKHRCFIDYTRCAVRRGINSIPPMTAAAALLSSFVRAVLTWRHRTVTSNCKQHDDTSSAASPLIARTTPNPLRSRRHQLHYAQPRHHRSSPSFNLAFGKREVLPWATKSASRFCHARQRFDRTSLAYSTRILRARSAKRLRAVGGLYRR